MRAIIGKALNSACKCPYKANGARWQRDAAWDILFKLQKRLLAPSSAVFRTVRTDAGDAEIKMPRRADAQRPAGPAMAAH
jgi:hypothetical protein